MKFIERLFQGRTNRRTYLVGVVLSLLLATVVQYFFPTANSMPPISIVVYLGLVVLLPYTISLEVRRLHDLGRTGWYTLLLLVPFINLLLLLLLATVPGQKKANKYGTAPKKIVAWKSLFGLAK